MSYENFIGLLEREEGLKQLEIAYSSDVRSGVSSASKRRLRQNAYEAYSEMGSVPNGVNNADELDDNQLRAGVELLKRDLKYKQGGLITSDLEGIVNFGVNSENLGEMLLSDEESLRIVSGLTDHREVLQAYLAYKGLDEGKKVYDETGRFPGKEEDAKSLVERGVRVEENKILQEAREKETEREMREYGAVAEDVLEMVGGLAVTNYRQKIEMGGVDQNRFLSEGINNELDAAKSRYESLSEEKGVDYKQAVGSALMKLGRGNTQQVNTMIELFRKAKFGN